MTGALLNVSDAAAYLGTTRSHMYSMVHQRTIPFIKLGDGRFAPVRFALADLDAWIAAHRIEAAAS